MFEFDYIFEHIFDFDCRIIMCYIVLLHFLVSAPLRSAQSIYTPFRSALNGCPEDIQRRPPDDLCPCFFPCESLEKTMNGYNMM